MSALPRLEVANLTRSYDGRRAVDDLSLAVGPGQVTCLLGPSGCGKSTTLRIIAGVERQDAGEVCVEGQPISNDSINVAPEERRIGLMFQDFALFPHLSVADNVGFGLRGDRSRIRQQVEALLHKVGMSRHVDQYSP